MATPPLRRHLATLVDDFEQHGSRIAVVSSRGLRRTATTYGDLALLARRFAAALEARGICKGERVLLWGNNSAEWVGAFFGCVLRGVLPVPLDAAGSLEFAARVAADVSPRLIVTDGPRAAAAGFTQPTLLLDDLRSLLPDQPSGLSEDLSGDDSLQIIFTSGTTGDPKGIVHTHRNVLVSLAPIEQELLTYLKYARPFRPVRFLHTLPLSHVFGQFMGLWVPPLLAAEVHYQDRLVAAELTSQIRRERISVLAAVPRVLGLMREYCNTQLPDLASRIAAAPTLKAWQRWWKFRDVHRLLGWKFWAFVCGGATLSAEGEQFWNSVGFVVVQGYGMTETTALVSLNHPFRRTPGTLGHVLPGRQVRLSEEGEVLVRGETIALNVWSKGALQQRSEEWLHTGDLGAFDETGNLTFKGRKKDIIVTAAGLNIHPEDLESALLRQPGVRAAAVIETDSGHGPEPLAVLVLAPEANERKIIELVNGELANFQQMRRWIVWPEPDLPRTSTGKTLRREIVRRVAAGETIQDRANAGLNLDSLGRVQLQAELEQQYGISLADADLQTVQSTSDLQALIASGLTKVGIHATQADAHHYHRWPWNPFQQMIRMVFLEVIALPLVRLIAKPQVRMNAPLNVAGPVFIVANHITSYDAALVLFALPRKIRNRVAVAMSGEMLLDMRKGRKQGNWFLNLLAPVAYVSLTALFNVFPLPQQSGFRRSFHHAGEAVDHSYSILVFPEGRRSEDGSAQPFRAGAGLLWRDLAIPALPVYLSGLGEMKSQHANWFRSGKIEVTVGEILPLDARKSLDELTGELRRGVFGG